MLSLINVEVNARVDRFENTMWRAADIADASMAQAAANADKFQSAFDRAADGAGQSADRMAGNFEAANDRVMNAAGGAAEAIDGISQAADRVDLRTWQEKLSHAFGQGVGAGMEATRTWLDKVEEFAKTKLILLGVAIAAGVTLGAVTAVYAAYQVISGSIGFITGLFSGESYKSANIDALIALNAEVKTLQEGLPLTAVQASALNEALKAEGVDKSSYVSTINAAANAARTNGDELDRLGVKYKAVNGELLSQQEILQNAKRVLDAYTEGYDRNAAAAAIGMGSYKEISAVVSVTSEKIETAKQRLIDYNLIIGEGTQEAVTAYEKSMRAFQRESDLTAQGFKKAIADQVMPILTDMADFFREGFPFAVNVFRYSMATLTSLFYGLKEVVYVVTESILESFGGIADVVSRVAAAFWKVAQGDFAGAWDELKAVPDDLGKRWDAYWANLNAQSERNLKAMKLAWGADSISAAIDGPEAAKKGKSWVPKPQGDEEDKPKAFRDPRDSYAAFLEELDRMTTKVQQNEYAMLRLKAVQKAFAEDADLNLALEKIDALQKAESAKAVKDYTSKLEEENQKLLDKRGAIGLVGIELDVYNMREQRRAEVMARINELERAGKPLTDEARQSMIDAAADSANAAEKILRQNDAIARSWDVGMSRAVKSYLDEVQNAARQSERFVSGVLKAGEDAWVKWATTGKANISDVFTMLAQEAARAYYQKQMAPVIGAGVDWLGKAIGGLFMGNTTPGYSTGDLGAGVTGTNVQGSYAGNLNMNAGSGLRLPSFDVGTDYVPHDMIAQIHEGERITPKAFNPAVGNGGAPVININVRNEAAADGYQATATANQNGGGIDVELLVRRVVQNDQRNNGPMTQGFANLFNLNRRGY